jgi:8-oxo-dGTP pyrophosphatase MutT (NUDIX family)
VTDPSRTPTTRTDPAEQLVEVVDEDGAVIEVVTRAEMRRRQLRHRCTYVVVQRSSGAVVVHQRAAWKDVSPSAWDLAFGGVCDVGEAWEPSARRELEEEAGLTDVVLTDLGQVAWSGDGAHLIGRVFLAVHDGPLAPSDGEVVALDEVPVDDLEAWVARTDTVDDSPSVVLPLLQRDADRRR